MENDWLERRAVAGLGGESSKEPEFVSKPAMSDWAGKVLGIDVGGEGNASNKGLLIVVSVAGVSGVGWSEEEYGSANSGSTFNEVLDTSRGSKVKGD